MADLTREELERFFNTLRAIFDEDRPLADRAWLRAISGHVEAAALKGLEAGWQPIETAPKDGTNILIIDMTALEPMADLVHFDGKVWHAGHSDFTGEAWERTGEYPTPTHWMHLPAAPTQEPERKDDWKCPACGKSTDNCLGHSDDVDGVIRWFSSERTQRTFAYSAEQREMFKRTEDLLARIRDERDFWHKSWKHSQDNERENEAECNSLRSQLTEAREALEKADEGLNFLHLYEGKA